MEKRGPGIILRTLFGILQIFWGFPQTVLGLIVFLMNRKERHERYRCVCHTVWKRNDYGLSLGMFVFTGDDGGFSDIAHEYGHCVQSLILGPLYLPVIGIPSWIHCIALDGKQDAESSSKYYQFYTEAWAERLAEHFRRRTE